MGLFDDVPMATPAPNAPAAPANEKPGGTFDDVPMAPTTWQKTVDFAKSVPRGALKGLMTAGSALGQATAHEIGQHDMAAEIPDADQTTGILEKHVTGDLHKPTTDWGRAGETVGEFVGNPAGYVGPGGFLGKALTNTTAGLGSEILGQAVEHDDPGSAPYARILGAVLGAKAPTALGRAVTPLPTSAARRAQVQTLRNEGIEPTAGQVTGNKSLRYMESELGDSFGAGAKATKAQEATAEDFTRAALRRVGEDAERATPEVIDRAFTRIGHQFDTLAARNHAAHDPQYVNDIIAARTNYDHLFLDPMKKPLVEKVFDQIVNHLVRSPQMDGNVYKSQRSLIERLRRANRSDPELSQYLAEVRDAMDGAMERTIARVNPGDLGAWRETRNQYRNMLALVRPAVGGGEQAASGLLSPARMRQSVVSTQGDKTYSRGHGDFADLTHAGNEILTPLPNSGTAGRLAARAVPTIIGAAFGGTGGLAGGLHTAGAGAMAGAVAGPAIAGRALMSRPAQAYLGNQLLARYLHNAPPNTLRTLLDAGPFVGEHHGPFTPGQ